MGWKSFTILYENNEGLLRLEVSLGTVIQEKKTTREERQLVVTLHMSICSIWLILPFESYFSKIIIFFYPLRQYVGIIFIYCEGNPASSNLHRAEDCGETAQPWR
jgi:hypothetical protein